MGLLDADELTRTIATESQRGGLYLEDEIDSLREEALDVPIGLTDLDMWANYINDDLYELDVKVREFLKRTRYKRQAKDGYRTTVPVVFAWIFGRKPEAGDGSLCRILHTLMKYYCTSYTGRTTYQGKPVSRVYRFSKYATNSKRPYSLRLRLEEADGEVGDALFNDGPGANADKRAHGRRADR